MYLSLPRMGVGINYNSLHILPAYSIIKYILKSKCTTIGVKMITRICKNCGKWEPVSYKTVSLYELEEKVRRLPVGSKRREKLLNKLVIKAENLQERIRRQNGSSINSDEVTT